jgi:hypothetical protein
MPASLELHPVHHQQRPELVVSRGVLTTAEFRMSLQSRPTASCSVSVVLSQTVGGGI